MKAPLQSIAARSYRSLRRGPLLLSGLLLNSFAIAQTPFSIDFTHLQGDVLAWSEANGWQHNAGFKKLHSRFEEGAMVLEATEDHSALLVFNIPDSLDLSAAKTITIDWQVDQYPAETGWHLPQDQKRETRQAIAVIVSFGPRQFSTGIPFLKAPYFLALFPSDNAMTGEIYLGNFFRTSGRYLCIDDSGTIERIQTTLNLHETFREAFNTCPPPITAIAIEVDAKNTPKTDGFHSRAKIFQITLSE
jgi:hypothetical protein